MTETSLHATDFAFVARFLREQCGLVLDPGKEYLVKSRLMPLVKKHGEASLTQLLKRLQRGGDQELLRDVIEAMVTTETSFFRDEHPFEALRQVVLPELVERRKSTRNLNIWCAACASGQEPYSVAMLLHESFPELSQWRVHLWATDISHQMLERSRLGRYLQVEVNRGLPQSKLQKWFRQEGSDWELDDRIRRSVTFAHLNLANPWPAMPEWDLILLRNVMIYFDDGVKKSILGRVSRVLRSDGFLVLGGAETTFNLDDAYLRVESLKSGFYQRKPS